MAGDNELVIRINGSAKDFIDELDKVKAKTKDLEKVLGATAKASAIAFAGSAAAIALVTKSFADYETALVGVGKTTNIEGKKLDKFGKQFQKLASEIPVSTNELLGIAQAAGQLGVEGEANILKFTETIAKLGVATDITGEEAATSIARILNVTKEGIGTIDTFGSVIVALGNNSAATESEIVKMTTEVARSSAVFGVSAAEAAALGTALKATGQQAQLGGSVIGKTFLQIQKAISGGGEEMTKLSELTGIAGDQLKKTFEDDASGVLQSFLAGLGNLEGGTSAIFKALEDFGLKGDEVNKVLPVLANNTDLVAKSFNLASAEIENATALDIEAGKAFNTLSAEAKKVSNNFKNITSNIGEQLAPAIVSLLESVNSLLKDISELDKETLGVIASFLKWTAIISGVVAGLASFSLGAIKISGLITAIAAGFTTGGIAAGGFWAAVTGPIGIAVAGIAAITLGFVKLNSVLDESKDKPETLEEVNGKIQQLKNTQKELNDELGKTKGLDVGSDFDNKQALEAIGEEIKALEELQQEKIKASSDFGTGALLQQEEFDPLAAPEVLAQKPISPLLPESSNEELKKSEKEKMDIVDSSTLARIEAAKRENEQLKELQRARNEDATQQELDNLQRKQEIENEFAEAKKIKNEEERALEIEGLKLKHEEELEAIEEFELAKDERDLERSEERAALKAETDALTEEQRAQFDQRELDALASKIDTQKEAEKKSSKERIENQIKERNQFKKDEIAHGTAVANIQSTLRSQEVQGLKSASGQLIALTQSKNSTLKGIGKASASVNAGIATAEGAIKAYTSLAGIPLIGPGLGVAAAGALIAFGVEQQAKISSLQTGGFVVPQGQGGARDRVPAMLEPNELVVPAAQAGNFIQAVGNTNSGDFANEDSTAPSGGGGVMRLEGDLIQNDEFVSALATQLREMKEFDNLES